jgi:hypothetical protein
MLRVGEDDREPAMQLCFGPYPMTIAQMKAWAQTDAPALTPKELGRALDLLDSCIIIRRVP